MQRTVPTQEVLQTLLVEIEGCLNTRPLTYQEWDENPISRPTDFIQPDIIISYPFELIRADEEDASYFLPGEAGLLKNRQQAEDALKSSHQLTERFWSIWSQQHLTSLRESHKLHIKNKRTTPKLPSIGTVVLIADAVIPRNVWKLGRIIDLMPSATGMVKEAELQTPNGRKTRRPINLVIPLELNNANDADDQHQPENLRAEADRVHHQRYDLRPKKKLELIQQDAYDDNLEPIVPCQEILETKFKNELTALDELHEGVQRERDQRSFEEANTKDQFEHQCMSALQTFQHSVDTIPRHHMSPEELSQALSTEYFAK
ncbi:hypothetical protein RB195_023062 [Necator americanus]|uniref:DUF5641 domain-containing protein n=1 Tax=Necator americanus TaxID=51031 RepID=A0ABR1EI07_NECAM